MGFNSGFKGIKCDKPFQAISRVGLLSFVGITFRTRESAGLEDKVTPNSTRTAL
jgi:hypothetical protein